MAKKINRANKKKRLVRSSSIEKTINEGKDYVNRVDLRLRAARVRPVPVAAPKKVPIAKKAAKKVKVVRGRAIRVAPVPAVLPPPTSVVPVSAVARTASRDVARTGSRNVARTGSKNSQIIEQ